MVRKKSGLGHCSVTEPVRSIFESHGLVPGRGLVDPSKGIVPICLENPSNEPILLLKGTVLAIAHPILDVRALEGTNVPCVNQVNVKSGDADIDTAKPDLNSLVHGPLLSHLQELLEKSSQELIFYDFHCQNSKKGINCR